MAMIDQINKDVNVSSQGIQQYQKSEPVRNEVDKPAGGGAAVASETVDLSAKSKELQRIRQIVDQIPDVREEKVQDLKSRIESGSYTIDSGKLATKMLGASVIDKFA